MNNILTSIKMLALFTIITGIIYPLAMTGIAAVAFNAKSNGSIISVNGSTVGSVHIGQEFALPKYFHGRPSASTYDPLASGGSNYGPAHEDLIKRASASAAQFRKENSLTNDTLIPSEMVLASGSGLDPHITLPAALLQSERVAHERHINKDVIVKRINELAEYKYFDLFGEKIVNVLLLNIALDRSEK